MLGLDKGLSDPFRFREKTRAIMRNGERRIDALEDQETGNHREMADNDEVAILSFFSRNRHGL